MTIDNHEQTLMSVPRPAANLVVKQGPQIGIVFPITGNRVVLGREDTCDIIVQDAEASRRHCEISWQNRSFVLQDLGSTNGTFVNGLHVTASAHLKSGSTIGIGQSVLVFETETFEPAIQTEYERVSTTPPPHAPTQPPSTPVEPASTGYRKWLLLGCVGVIVVWICMMIVLAILYFTGIINISLPFSDEEAQVLNTLVSFIILT